MSKTVESLLCSEWVTNKAFLHPKDHDPKKQNVKNKSATLPFHYPSCFQITFVDKGELTTAFSSQDTISSCILSLPCYFKNRLSQFSVTDCISWEALQHFELSTSEFQQSVHLQNLLEKSSPDITSPKDWLVMYLLNLSRRSLKKLARVNCTIW